MIWYVSCPHNEPSTCPASKETPYDKSKPASLLSLQISTMVTQIWLLLLVAPGVTSVIKLVLDCAYVRFNHSPFLIATVTPNGYS